MVGTWISPSVWKIQIDGVFNTHKNIFERSKGRILSEVSRRGRRSK